MRMNYKPAIIIVLMLVNIYIVQADDITITRSVPPESKYGDQIKITISLTNNIDVKKTYEVKERLPLNTVLIDPQKPSETRMFNAVEVSFLAWTLDLNPGETKSVSYTIRPDRIGDYTIINAEAVDISTTEIYNSAKSQFDVTCISDNICNTDIGENYLTCPADCTTGFGDGICNSIPDNQCDPDCTKDPDCAPHRFNILYIIVPISVIVLVLLFYFFKKPKRGMPYTENQEKQGQNNSHEQKPEGVLYS